MAYSNFPAGPTGARTLEELIKYYQKSNPDLATQDFQEANDRFNGTKLADVSGIYTYTPAVVGQNMENERGGPIPALADGSYSQDPEFKKRLAALRWGLVQEGLNSNHGYLPQEANSDPIFGPIADLFNPKDLNKAKFDALMARARG